MMSLVSAVWWRYLAIFVQFVVVLLVTNRVPLSVAGQYFGLFGVVTVIYAFAGGGVADGLVRHLPRLLQSGPARRAVRQSVQAVVVRGVASTLIPAIVIALGFAVVRPASSVSAWLVAGWSVGYALVFLLGQVALALGSAHLGSFLAYTCINLCYLVTLVPYLVVATSPTLTGLLTAAVAGTAIAAGISVAGVRLALRSAERRAQRGTTPRLRVSEMMRSGAPMMVTRFIQGAVPWVPVWLLLAVASPEAAAVYAAGSRLLVVVSSVIGSIRFAVRPRLVVLMHRDRFADVERLARACSAVAVATAAVAAVSLLILGPKGLERILGSGYVGTYPVVMLLIAAAFAEGIGGISDEILKMNDMTGDVLVSQCVALTAQAGLGLIASSSGPTAMAGVTATAIGLQYAIQVYRVRTGTPVRVLRRFDRVSAA